jgi:putative nucleotidyltransferase with HDIG domain
MFTEARLGKAVDASKCMPLVEDITGSVARNPSALVSLARLKTHDDYTYMHSVAVCALMVSLARQLGLDEAQTREAGLAGLLHDLGKSAMPLAVLNKPGKLTDAEFALMREHPQRGYDALRDVGTAGEATMDVVLHHHERMDGKGYPHGLAGEQISLLARMGAVCDVYDAVTSNRPYKEAWDPGEAVARMASWAPAHLDPVVFQNFVKALGIYPIGSLVKLQSGRLAVVVEQNARVLTSPAVRVFFSTKSNVHITPELVDLASPHCADRIVGRESNKTWGFQKLDQLWAGTEALQSLGR